MTIAFEKIHFSQIIPDRNTMNIHIKKILNVDIEKNLYALSHTFPLSLLLFFRVYSAIFECTALTALSYGYLRNQIEQFHFL